MGKPLFLMRSRILLDYHPETRTFLFVNFGLVVVEEKKRYLKDGFLIRQFPATGNVSMADWDFDKLDQALVKYYELSEVKDG